MKDGLPSEAFIEFDLVLNVCGVDLNIITIRREVKVIMDKKSVASESIYKRDIFLNLNYDQK